MSDCHSCRLCDLACSAWRFSRDGECAPRAMVLMDQRQQAISTQQLAYCTLCGACDAACPVGLQPMRTIVQQGDAVGLLAPFVDHATRTGQQLLLSADRSVAACFPDSQWLDDCGADIVRALSCNGHIASQRLQQFIASLADASSVVVADGLLLYALKKWLPHALLISLAEALLPQRKHGLQSDDLLLLDAPAFNADRVRLLPMVQQAVAQSGAMTSLDLQQLAIPLRSYRVDEAEALAARWQWLSRQRQIGRIVAENPQEVIVAAAVSGLPAVWLGALGVG
ncbi:MAG: (Fe-S)-binding protein [Mariprofundales bacterium]